MADQDTRSVEQAKDFGTDNEAIVRRWLAEIRAYEKQFGNWDKRARTIVKRYRDERNNDRDTRRSFNILWSNVQTLGPAIYAKKPKADVTRRYRDRDPVGRAAATVAERCLDYTIDSYDFNDTAKEARDDYLLTGRGQAWVRYVAHHGEETTDRIPLQEVETEDGGTSYLGEDGQAVPGEMVQQDMAGAFMQSEPYRPVLYEEVVCDHIAWNDFGHTPAPTWNKVTAVWKREQLTRAQLIERFGSQIGNEVQLQKKMSNVTEEDLKEHGDVFKRAEVYEIWDKTDKQAIWISPGYTKGPLDKKPDPLKLECFFPCPRPIYGTMTSDTLVPVPDYTQYQSQAEELDMLTQRLRLLMKALRVAGAYDAAFPKLESIIRGEDNQLVAVDNWAMFAEKGGLQGVISFLPIKEIADVAIGLTNARAQVKQDLYEISGISDIIRGQVDPREKLGQSRIKGQFATLRLKDRQAEMDRFLRDILRIKAEIIAEHFDPQTIREMSGWEQTEEAQTLDRTRQAMMSQMQQMQQGQQPGMMSQLPQQIPPSSKDAFKGAVALLKDDRLRTFRVEVETDSTAFEDEAQEKETRVEFLTAAGGFIQNAVMAGEKFPQITPLLGEMLLFGVRGFKAGRRMEAVFEEAIEDLRSQPPQPQPDPNAAQKEADQLRLAFDKEKFQAEQQRAEADSQRQQEQYQLDMAHKQDMLQLERDKAETTADQKRQELLAQHGPTIVDALERMHQQVTGNSNSTNEALTQIAQSLAIAAQAMSENTAMVQQVAMAMGAAVEGMNTPKRIVFDESGKPVGVEPVTVQ